MKGKTSFAVMIVLLISGSRSKRSL